MVARQLRAVVAGLRECGREVLVVDDGSGPDGAAACAALADDGLAMVVRHEHNRGKGAACRTGFDRAHELGYTHAFQVDADGQHDLDAVPAFVAAAEARPVITDTVEVLVPGYGWWGLDPTNQKVVGELHVKIGHGRDYEDVMPLRGVYHGDAESGGLEAGVKMSRVALSAYAMQTRPVYVRRQEQQQQQQ